MTKKLILLAAALVWCAPNARPDMKYDDCAGSKYGVYDVLPDFQGGLLPSRFEQDDYHVAPLADGECDVTTVYLQGRRLARVKPLTTEVLDLDTATVTTVDRAKRMVTVRSIESYQRSIRRSLLGGVPLAIQFEKGSSGSDHPKPYEATAIALSGVKKGHIAVRAEYWMIASIPFKEVTNFIEDCLKGYGPDDAGMCSLGNPEQFAGLEIEARKLGGYPVMRIIEWTQDVPMGGKSPPGSRIFRTVSRLSNFKSGAVNEEIFAIPTTFRVRQKD